jgi:hypothetical protein
MKTRPEVCIAPDCSKPHVARGLCRRHYARWHRGVPVFGGPDYCTCGECARCVGRAKQRETNRRNFEAKPCPDCGGSKTPGLGRAWCDTCFALRGGVSDKKKAYHRSGELRRRYGITLQDYADMFADQEGKCAICGGPPTTKSFRHFDVDHDGRTGKVRGLLCRRCNTALGYIESPIHAPALAYLEKNAS